MTVEELYALPDRGLRHELQGGTLVSEPLPGWRHGRVATRIAALLDNHVRPSRLGVVVANDTGFILSRAPDTVRGPDVAFVAAARLGGIGDPVSAFPGAPDLAIEVLSPTNTAASMHGKVADYLASGTLCVWVIDPETETVAVYRSLLRPLTLARGAVLEVEGLLPGMRVEVGELFDA
jgi:Uma2 family endonuclease